MVTQANGAAAGLDKKARRAAARKRRAAYQFVMQSSDSEDEDDDPSPSSTAAACGRGTSPTVSLLLLATAAVACGIAGGGPSPRQLRTRMNWDKNLKRMTRSEFSRMFRMDHSTFCYMVNALKPLIERDYLQSERGGGYISPSLQLGMTLRWLSGGSYLDIAQHYGVSKATFYNLVNAGCDAIVETFPVVFDMSADALKHRAAEFGQRQWPHMRVFKGIVGCLDGILIKIQCPSVTEHGMPRNFFCRKGFFALNVQVRFLWIP